MIPLRDDNPTHITPFVTIGLIATCILVFLFQFTMQGKQASMFIYQYGAIPAVVFGHDQLPPELASLPAWGSLITSMFLHGGWMHLIGNMLYLWIFGDNIEESMGHQRFVIFYALCGTLAALAHAITDSHSIVPMVGASGAISGVLGAYLLLFPRAQVTVLIPLGFFTQLIYVPAWVVLGFWFVLQVISGGASLGSEGGGVAWFAHVGGFVAGMALIGFFKNSNVRYLAPARHRAWSKSHW